MRLFLFFGLLAFQLSSLAQTTYSGLVKDAQTNEVLSDVLVESVSDETSKGITDENGRFSLTAQGNEFKFSFVGYELYQTKLQVSGNIIQLKAKSGYLSELVITGDKSQKRLSEVTMSLDIIKPQLVEKKNVIKVENVLQQVSSLSVTDKQVNIRNSSGWSYGAGSRVMILQDGMPMLSGDAGQPQWTFINTDNIQNIEIIKGASSLLYGSSALGGIVHIQTALPTDTALTRLQVYSGVFSKPNRAGLSWNDKPLYQHGIRFMDSRQIGKFDLVSNAQVITDDGYRMGDYEDRLRLGLLSRYRINSKSILSLNTQVMSNRSASFLLWESYDSAYTALDGDFTQNRGLRILIDPKYTRMHKNGKQLLQARYFRIKNDISNNDTGNDQSNSSHVYYAEYQYHQSFPKIKLKGIGGLVYQQTTSASPLFQGDHKTANQAAFFQIEKKWGKLRANAGGRYERYELDDYSESKPVLRFGLNYRASKYTFLRASYGEGYRFPTIAESFIRTSVGALNIFPNDSLKSESGTNMEIAVKQAWKIKKARGYVDLALFRMNYQDMMEFSFSQWSTDGLGLGFKSINVGKTQISGIELSGAAEIKLSKGSIQFFGGYTYTNPISLEPDRVVATNVYGIPISYDSSSSDPSMKALKYRYRHLARGDIQYSRGAFDIGLSTRYNSYMENIDRAFVSFPINLFVLGIAESRELNKAGDLLFDLRLSYSFKQLEMGLNVLNLFNREQYNRPADLGPPRYSNISIKIEI